MVILQTFNKPGGARRISTPMHTALLRSPHTDLTLPPVALQKGKRDAQVQFRGRRHKCFLLFQKSSQSHSPYKQMLREIQLHLIK
ncbi:hypothetical protein T08_15667 [Trichinella sp. T8]|nr:hypothetical protein T08_15667 [Trichinella sp. T8]